MSRHTLAYSWEQGRRSRLKLPRTLVIFHSRKCPDSCQAPTLAPLAPMQLHARAKAAVTEEVHGWSRANSDPALHLHPKGLGWEYRVFTPQAEAARDIQTEEPGFKAQLHHFLEV